MTGKIKFGARFCLLAVIAGLPGFLYIFASADAYAQRVITERKVMTRSPESLAAILEPYCEKYGLPAIAAAVVKDGRTLAMGTVGTRKMGNKIQVNSVDRFHIGSNTKAITSLVAAMYVQAGKLRWDSRLEEIFPEL
ncbi:MAG: serine hydrolase domain-containing protein, partial [Syntrophorhabdus sp.]